VSHNGNRYEGDWKDDQMWGEGVYHYVSGAVYEGSFAANLPNGWGELRGVNKTILAHWVDGKPLQ
jgi:hypothetical protein